MSSRASVRLSVCLCMWSPCVHVHECLSMCIHVHPFLFLCVFACVCVYILLWVSLPNYNIYNLSRNFYRLLYGPFCFSTNLPGTSESFHSSYTSWELVTFWSQPLLEIDALLRWTAGAGESFKLKSLVVFLALRQANGCKGSLAGRGLP